MPLTPPAAATSARPCVRSRRPRPTRPSPPNPTLLTLIFTLSHPSSSSFSLYRATHPDYHARLRLKGGKNAALWMAQPTLHIPQRPPPLLADDASPPAIASTGMDRSSSGPSPTVSGSRSAPPAPLATFLPWSPAAPSGFPTPSFEHQQQQQQQPQLPPAQSQGMSPTTSAFAPPSSPARSSLNVSQYSAGSVSSSHSFRTLNELPSPPPSRSGRGSFAAGAGTSPLLRLSPSTSFTTLPPPLTQLSLPLPVADHHQRTDSTLSNASSTRTSSFFATRVSVPPPAPPPPPGALEPGKALARAGSVGRAGLDSATVARLGVGLPGGSHNGSGGGRRADHPRSASDASSGPRPLPLASGSGAQMRETWAHKPFFAFERDQQAARAVSGPVTPRSGRVAGLPPSSSPPAQHAGLPHSQLAHAIGSAPSIAEPRAGEVLEEEEELELDPDGRELDGRRKRKRRRWRLEGAVVGRGAFSAVWGARELADGKDEPVEGSGIVAVKMMSKEACRENDRTFTSFAREVSILKVRSLARSLARKLRLRSDVLTSIPSQQRLSHPAIIPHLTSFTTPTHHCVVLPLIRGGELFAVIEEPARWERIGRGWVKRVWRELEAGVAYLHKAGVVHRDIKLESASSSFDASAYSQRMASSLTLTAFTRRYIAHSALSTDLVRPAQPLRPATDICSLDPADRLWPRQGGRPVGSAADDPLRERLVCRTRNHHGPRVRRPENRQLGVRRRSLCASRAFSRPDGPAFALKSR